jgi:hypothetical protein
MTAQMIEQIENAYLRCKTGLFSMKKEKNGFQS